MLAFSGRDFSILISTEYKNEQNCSGGQVLNPLPSTALLFSPPLNLYFKIPPPPCGVVFSCTHYLNLTLRADV